MKFKKYPSIENSYREKQIDQIRVHGYASNDIIYCVTEKIHGSNFGVYVDGAGVDFASRNNMLNEDNAKAFYKFDSIRRRVTKDVKEVFNHVKRINNDTESIIVYGELFGGHYPHPDIPKTKNVAQVQKGVYYSPNLEFSVFDIWVVTKDRGFFMNYNDMSMVCLLNDVDYCEIIFAGTFDKCLEYPNDNESGIPDKYNLPEMDDNVSEGVVIKPLQPLYYRNGERVILKNKNLKFSEKNSEKRVLKPIAELSEEMQTTLAGLDQYITENRFDSVDSKLGGLEKRTIGNYIKEFVHDVFVDANKDGIIPHHLEKSEQKILNKFVSEGVKKIILPKV